DFSHQPVGGPRHDGAFDHHGDEAAGGFQAGANLPGRRGDVPEVNFALGGRGADGDENEGGVPEGVVAGQGGAEPLFGKDAAEQFRQARLVNVGLGAVELFNNAGAEVEADDLVALGRQANARNQAD